MSSNSIASLAASKQFGTDLNPPVHAYIPPDSLSTLSPFDPIYGGGYGSDANERDAARKKLNTRKLGVENPDTILEIANQFVESPLMKVCVLFIFVVRLGIWCS